MPVHDIHFPSQLRHNLNELSRKEGCGLWRCLRMKTRASPRDITSLSTDESELSSPSLSTSSKWRDPDTESKSGLRGWNAIDPTASAIALFILIILKVVSIPSCARYFRVGAVPQKAAFSASSVGSAPESTRLNILTLPFYARGGLS